MNKQLKYLLTSILIFISAATILNYLFPLPIKRLTPPHSTIIRAEDGSISRIFLSPDGCLRLPMTEEQITAQIRDCVLFFEDRYFYYHPGCNPFSICRAILHNLLNKRKIGASTITMQLARMIEQRPRTIAAKIIEIFRALQIEWYFHKNEILLFYLNMAPYGGNIEGLQSAAFAYFHKKPAELSLAETSLLVQVPKNPNKNRPDRLQNPRQQKNIFLQKISSSGFFSPESIKRAKLEQPEIIKPAHKIHAPHFTNHPHIQSLIDQRPIEIHSSINTEMQKFTEILLINNLKKQAVKGVKNAAALIIHNPTMQIKAYVGSENFFSDLNGGQNDGLRMKRSPGSAFKPFIYALALEQGIITPKRLLPDIPVNFSGYSPKNYNSTYHGLISAENALRLSLNTPAVQLNEALDPDFSLYELLQKAEIKSINLHKKHYGAAISLGGAEISLLELTHLYTVFANSGQLHPLNFTMNNPKSLPRKKPIRLLSPQSSWLIANILTEAPRTTLNSYWEANPQNVPVAFKTGTSARRSDFLAVGFSSEYTVGVWFGNFCGKKADYGSGVDTAAPSLLEIFAWLNRRSYPSPIPRPENIYQQEICADLLQSPEQNCHSPVMDYIIKDKSLQSGCRLLQSEQFSYLITRGLYKAEDIRKICRIPIDLAPEIRHPPQKINRVSLSRMIPAEYQKNRFECQSYQTKDDVYLFINGIFHKKLHSGQSDFITLQPGLHELGCMDEKSAYSSVKIEILN